MEGSFNQLLTEAKKAGYVPAVKDAAAADNLSPAELYEKLRILPMWCYDDHKHEDHPDTYEQDYCCLTHTVGLPRHPATNEPMALTPFQVDFIERVQTAVRHPAGMTEDDWKRLHHMFHILKGRQMGFTEIVLRLIQYFCFNRYAGRKIGILAATNGELAKKDLRRFARLFNNIKKITKGKITNKKLTLINDCEVEAYPASEEALTGDTKYACIYMDESAKWRIVDDTPVFNSVMPIVRSNGADLFLVSTGKGPVKMFYKIYKEPQDFIMMEYNIWRTEGNLYTTTQIENMIASSKEDPDQEYLCKFTIGRESILGAIKDADRSDNVVEWDAPINMDDEDEDDSYVESDAEKDDEWGGND